MGLYYVFDNRGRLDQVFEVACLTAADPEIADRIQAGWQYCEVDHPTLWGSVAAHLPGLCSIDGDEIVVDSTAQISAALARQEVEVLEHREVQVAAEMAGLQWLETHRGSLSTSQVAMRASGRRQLDVLGERRKHLECSVCEIPDTLARVAGQRFPIARRVTC